MTAVPRFPSAVLSRIATVICGNWPDQQGLSPYRTHSALADFFFCDLGLEYHGSGSESRAGATEAVLAQHNGTPKLREIIEAAVHPANFSDVNGGPSRAVEYLNKALKPCGCTLERQGELYRLVPSEGAFDVEAPDVDILSRGYAREMADKAEKRLHDEDYDGAVTTARTLVESVLVEIEQRITGQRRDHERDLQGQFTVVRKHLNIDEERPDLDESFKMMIKGLILVINGLAPLRNKMSDGHARSRKPAPHHARFAVNAAKTVAYFLVESYAYQLEKGLIRQVEPTTVGSG